MFLVGDIGNTETKICLLNNRYKQIKKITLNTQKLSMKYLTHKTLLIKKNFKNVEKLLFSSVVPDKYKVIKKFFKIKTKKNSFEIKELNLNKIINIKVNKKQIGSDRLANAIGVFKKDKNYIIIDFGTATTFDVVKSNNYIGGVIAPGVQTSLNNQSSKASLIPNIKLKKIKKILGKNTNNSVISGFYWGYIGLINKIIFLIKRETKINFKIIVTGGLAHIFKNSFDYKINLNKDITLNGIIKLVRLLN